MAIGPGNPPKMQKIALDAEDVQEILLPGNIEMNQLVDVMNWIGENYPKKDLVNDLKRGGVFDPKRSALEMIRDGDAAQVKASIKALRGVADGTFTGAPFYLGGNKDTSFNR